MTPAPIRSSPICSPLLDQRGDWQAADMRKYVTTPGDIQNTLSQLGGTGDATVASIISLDHQGEITGSRVYIAHGEIWNVGYRATHIFAQEGTLEDIELELTLPATAFSFPPGGEIRNLSSWVDAAPFMKVRVNGTEVEPEQWPNIGGICNGLSLRACLLPMSPLSFTLQVFYYPRALESLTKTCRDRKIPMEALTIPCGRLYSGRAPSVSIRTFPTEQEGDNVGLGIYPLLEAPRLDIAKLPTRDQVNSSSEKEKRSQTHASTQLQVDEELADLLGHRVFFPAPLNTPDELEAALAMDSWQVRVLDPKPIYWPPYQGPTVPEDAISNSGELSCAPSESVPSVIQVSQVMMRPGTKKYGTDQDWNIWAPAPLIPASLPDSLTRQFDKLMSASLAKATWSSLRSAERVATRTAEEFNLDLR